MVLLATAPFPRFPLPITIQVPVDVKALTTAQVRLPFTVTVLPRSFTFPWVTVSCVQVELSRSHHEPEVALMLADPKTFPLVVMVFVDVVPANVIVEFETSVKLPP